MNACGDTGAAGDSDGGGAGVSKRARIREYMFLCGDGSRTRLLGDMASVSQTSHRVEKLLWLP